MSNLSDFLTANNITPEQLVSTSQALEKLSPEEREKMVARTNARRTKKAYAELNIEKPAARGRGITLGTVQRAIAGQPVPRLVRHKIVRAVNAHLTSAKKDNVDWRPLFSDVPSKKGKKKK